MQLPRAIDLVLLIKYDARAAKIKLSGIVCYYYFFVNEMLSQINQKNSHVSKENVYIRMWNAVYEYSKDI